MAKRGRKKTASKRRKVQSTAARKKAGKRGAGKTATKKVANRTVVKAKLKKRPVRKKAAPPAKETRPKIGKPVAEVTEATVVDIIEEPAPGVMVVTEIETVESTKPPEDDEGSD